jgi:HK97 gp10 family phage protein
VSDVGVRGLKEINAFLQQLPAKIEKNVLRGGLRAGARVVQAEVKATAPVATGQLRDGVKVSTGGKGGQVVAKVKLTGPHAFLGNWLEYGTAAHQITAAKGGWLTIDGGYFKAVDHPGMQARPFMRPALDGKAQAAVVAAAEYMKRRLATKHGLDTADVEIEAL